MTNVSNGNSTKIIEVITDKKSGSKLSTRGIIEIKIINCKTMPSKMLSNSLLYGFSINCIKAKATILVFVASLKLIQQWLYPCKLWLRNSSRRGRPITISVHDNDMIKYGRWRPLKYSMLGDR